MSTNNSTEGVQRTSKPLDAWQSRDGKDVISAAPANPRDDGRIWDFVTFLAVAQDAKIDFLSITWPRGVGGIIGTGGTAKVRESVVNLEMSFAFKVTKDAEQVEQLDKHQRLAKTKQIYRRLISEISILGHPAIQNHSNIISLLGICWDILPSGCVWPALAFEKASYKDLWNFVGVNGKNLEVETRLKLCADVATGIRDLHRNGIIHGDVKPDNVLIFKDGPDTFVAKVTDFGYSTILAGEGGIFMPKSDPWTAPEYHEEREYSFFAAQKMDAYSFGSLCLWFMLSISEETSRDWKSILENFKKEEKDGETITKELIMPHVDLQADEKETLKRVFYLTLRNDPCQRCGDFDRLLGCIKEDRNDLHELAGVISNTKTKSPLFSVAKAAQALFQADIRVRAYVVKQLEEHLDACDGFTAQHYAFELCFCLKIGFGAAKSDKYVEYLQRSQRPELDLRKAVEKLDTEDGWANDLVAGMSREGYLQSPTSADLHLEKDQCEEVLKQCRKELSDLEHELPKEYTVFSSVQFVLFDMLYYTGRYEEAEELVLQNMQTSKKIFGDNHPRTLSYLDRLASTYWSQGKWKEAEELEVQVMRTRSRMLGEEHPGTLTSMANLASTYRNQGRWKEAEELEVQVMRTRSRVLGEEHPATLTSMASLASTYRNQGRWKEAEGLEVQVVRAGKEVLGEEHPDTLSSIANLALTYWNQGRWKEAEELHVQVMRTRSRVLGEEHPGTLTSMASLASTYWNQGRWKESEELEVQVMRTSKRVLGEEHPDTLTSIANLASTYHNQGRWKEAEELEVQVMRTSKRVLGEEHPSTLNSIANLASTYRKQGQWKEAEELDVQVMRTRSRVLGEEHPDTLTNMANLASTYRNQRQWKEAEELDMQVMRTRSRVLGEKHPDTLSSIANLASTYRNQGRWKEAEELDMQVTRMSKRVLGEEHPDTLANMANLASTYRKQGQWKEAKELEVQVMRTRARLLGEEHPDTLTSMANLASTYRKQGRWKEAEELGVQVMRTRARVLGEEHPSTLTSMANLASTYWNQGRWKEAEELNLQVLEIIKRVLEDGHSATLQCMHNLAITQNSQGKNVEACNLMEECFHLRKQNLGSDHPDTQKSLDVLNEWKLPDVVLDP